MSSSATSSRWHSWYWKTVCVLWIKKVMILWKIHFFECKPEWLSHWTHIHTHSYLSATACKSSKSWLPQHFVVFFSFCTRLQKKKNICFVLTDLKISLRAFFSATKAPVWLARVQRRKKTQTQKGRRRALIAHERNSPRKWRYKHLGEKKETERVGTERGGEDTDSRGLEALENLPLLTFVRYPTPQSFLMGKTIT